MYEELFGDGPRAIVAPNPYRMDTPLFSELALIAEFTGGSIVEWNKKSLSERRMWLYYKILLNEKKIQQQKDAQQEADARSRTKNSMPKVTVDRPGLRG